MRSLITFNAWLKHAIAYIRIGEAAAAATTAAEVQAHYDQQRAMEAKGQRLWDACLADGWTPEEGETALEREVGR